MTFFDGCIARGCLSAPDVAALEAEAAARPPAPIALDDYRREAEGAGTGAICGMLRRDIALALARDDRGHAAALLVALRTFLGERPSACAGRLVTT